MRTDAGVAAGEPEQADDEDGDIALALLADSSLGPLFRPQARSGIASAWHAHVPFAQWLVAATRPALIVELGTHNGVSYAAFCETVLQERLAARCYAVDSWAGDDHAGHYDGRVYTELREFHDGRYSAFSELLRMTFSEARDVIADGSVDLLHIDGFHSYDAVRQDFEGWLPKLSTRAVVLFHDINVLERGFGVARFWAELEGQFPSFAFLHGHGLGVLAVGRETPPALRRLCTIGTSPAAAVLRDRFATLGRVHALDCALAETARHEQRLRREASGRDALVEDLRRSLSEVLSHRDALLAEKAQAEQRLPAQEATITSLRSALHEAKATLDDVRRQAGRLDAAAAEKFVRLEADARDQVARLEAELRDQSDRLEADVRDRERQIGERDNAIGRLEAQMLKDAGELGRQRTEIDVLRGNLAAARADAKSIREEGRAEAVRLQAEIGLRDGQMADLLAAAEPLAAVKTGPAASRGGFGIRSRRH
ncbi:class I SAM-dependent methyltransferase [Acidisoma sp.]|uniref:class I SAM-dependent methyltransferase n=1 Tax=Acidisoma sp. TaxID=1872115 RepID=UPI003B00AF53